VDVRQLAALVAIADHGTFSAAARALFTVQSNVSSHIARLEKELGTVLVDRAHGGLTDDGARVVERARRVLRELDDIAAEMAQRGDDVVGDVRLGMLGTTARWLLPRLLAEMSARLPHVRVIVAEGSTSVLIPALLSGQYDAAIVHLPVDEPELTIEPLFAEDLLLLVGDGHPLAGRPTIHLAELAGHRLLLPPPGSALRRVLDRAALSVGAQLEAEAEVDGVRLLAALAVDGHGAAIVPATAVPQRPDGRFATVHVPELPPRVVALTSHRRPGPSGAAEALFGVLRAVLPGRALEQAGVRLGSDAFPLLRATR
jgi:LysR family transcriptional regulator, hydrogen peroxide-inducible genes activator